MEVYITKYALTKGIMKAEGKFDVEFPKMIGVRLESSTAYFFKPEWHETLKDAQERAELLRSKKIKSLEKQLNKLRDLKIGVETGAIDVSSE